jgi:beta-N-acetylhexosaminidase
VFTNPKNTVIGNRAFSSDPVIAAQMVAAMAQGLRDQGIIATFKHFPGHGDTAEDSHSGIAVNHKTIEQLLQCEWLPFMEATERDMIMVGHIAVPQITGDQTPATLSYTLVTEILKNQLGFDGLIVTDSLRMGAIHGVYQPGEAALLALEAGCHVLLMPSSLSAAFDAVVAAVEEGSFPLEKLDSIVCKVLEFKLSHGIL